MVRFKAKGGRRWRSRFEDRRDPLADAEKRGGILDFAELEEWGF